MILWRINREDLRPLLLIALLPILVALPLLLGFRNADPATYMAGIRMDQGQTILLDGGSPVRDGNNGTTMQALGYRAAREILHGRMPWWNSYSGVGLPLAAEYQPGAFFPLTFMLLLPQGVLLEHLLLQMLAGWGTYALLRQLNLGRLAVLTGGILFAFSGTLALYDNGAAVTLPFLPWMLLGVERAFAKVEAGLRGGWRIFAVSLGLNLLAGFPESAYLNGLLVLAWALLRVIQTQPEKRRAFIWRAALGGVVGLALAAPQVFAFLQSLPLSYALFHDGQMVSAAPLKPVQLGPSLIAPYVFGPIYKYAFATPVALNAWAGLGGYVTASLLVVATYGAVARRAPLLWLLSGWTIFALAKSFGFPPAVFLWNLVPGITLTSVATYGPPTWTMALVILAAYGIDDLAATVETRRAIFLVTGIVTLVVCGTAIFGFCYWKDVHAIGGLRLWTGLSLAWAALSALICATLLMRPLPRWNAQILAVLLVIEGAIMFAVPTMSNPPGSTKLDMHAIDFLRSNLGLNRFHTLGPIWANYGAYYGVASVNYIYVPVPLTWTNWEERNLDGDADSMMVFFRNGHGSSGADILQRLSVNIPLLEWTGVKYIVTDPKQALQASALSANGARNSEAPKKVYADAIMDIFELPNPSPYFEIISGRCSVVPSDRLAAEVDCASPATLLRRELFYPGWTASVSGADTTITKYRDLFQTIALPRGKSVVRFRYAPPHIAWMWLVFWLGLGALALSAFAEFGLKGRTLNERVATPV